MGPCPPDLRVPTLAAMTVHMKDRSVLGRLAAELRVNDLLVLERDAQCLRLIGGTGRGRTALLTTGLAVLLAACSAADPPSTGGEPTVSATATMSATAETTLTQDPTPSPSSTATVEPTEAATGEPTAVPSIGAGEPGGFTVAPNPEADALFLDRDTCENLRDGYQLEFPEDWYTNTEVGRFPPCIWFAPGFYTVPDATQVPDEIAIELFRIDGARGYLGDPVSREEVVVGGQSAVRIEISGTADNQSEGTMYEYVIQLGPTLEEGPNLIARTDTDMGGDYELNKAVLDRIMATIEFIGSIQ